MDMQQVCAAALEEVDGALGCIVMDMQTGLTVAAEYRPGSSVNDGTINLFSVVSANMFAGRLIRQFEGALGTAPTPGFVREVQMTTANTNQFMAAIPGWDEGVFVLVTEKSVSLGLGWMAVHRVVERLQGGGRQDAANDGQAAWPDQQVGGERVQRVRAAPPLEVAAPQYAPQRQPSPAQHGGAPLAAPPQAMPPRRPAAPVQGARPSARAAAPSALGRTKKEPEKEQEERPVAVGARANFLSRKKK